MSDPQNPQKPRHLYETIAERIHDMVRTGELKPGDRLPAERNLAASFGVSRNCVREAIRSLTEKRVVISRRGDGNYICQPDDTAWIASMAQAFQDQKSRLKEMMDFRLLLEPAITRMAALTIKETELEALKLMVFEQERYILAGKDLSELDRAFHLKLARATHNRFVMELMQSIGTILEETRCEFLQSPYRRRETVKGHIRIIDALENRDAVSAESAMRQHLTEIQQLLFGTEVLSEDLSNRREHHD